jgi:hypothetical protein
MEERTGFVEPVDWEIIIKGDVGGRNVRKHHEIAKSLKYEIKRRMPVNLNHSEQAQTLQNQNEVKYLLAGQNAAAKAHNTHKYDAKGINFMISNLSALSRSR